MFIDFNMLIFCRIMLFPICFGDGSKRFFLHSSGASLDLHSVTNLISTTMDPSRTSEGSGRRPNTPVGAKGQVTPTCPKATVKMTPFHSSLIAGGNGLFSGKQPTTSRGMFLSLPGYVTGSTIKERASTATASAVTSAATASAGEISREPTPSLALSHDVAGEKAHPSSLVVKVNILDIVRVQSCDALVL